jgi:iron(III) transport system permease protein
VQKGGGGLAKRDLRGWEKAGCYAVVIFILLLVLSPHIGLTLLSFGTVWSYSVLPDAFTWAHYVEMYDTSASYINNTLIYAGLAALIDVIFATAIAYIVWRTQLAWRKWLDFAAMGAVAIPGVVIGIGYLRTFYEFNVPIIDKPLATWWVIIVIALAIRRLPYALRACVAALQQVSETLEEAAENLGATKARTVTRIVVPLMSGGMLAGFITSFATASVELSATIMLVSSESDAPLAYGIYEFMQSASGRGPGAALGIIAVVIVGVATYFSHRFVERGKVERTPEIAIPSGA